MYIRREMISGLHRLLAVAADESVDLGDALAGLHQLIEHLEGKTDFAGCLRDMDRLMLDTLRQMDGRVANNRNGITGIPTGLRDLRWARPPLPCIWHWRRDVPGSRCW